MSDPTPPTPPPWAGQPAPPPWAGQPAPRRRPWVARHKVLTAVAGLAALAAVGLAAGMAALVAAGGGGPVRPPAAGPTSDGLGLPSDAADGIQETAPPPPEVGYTPTVHDFTLGLKVLDKECFGSAGCNVQVRVDFRRIDSRVPQDGSFEVTYELRGGKDGQVVGTIAVNDGSYDPPEELVQTTSSATKLTVAVTDVA